MTGALQPGSPGFGRGLPLVGRLAGVLDFGTMATGDPAYDVTPAWHLLDRAGRPAFRGIGEVLADLA